MKMKKLKLGAKALTLTAMFICLSCNDDIEKEIDSSIVESTIVSKNNQIPKLYFDRVGNIIGDGFIGNGFDKSANSIRPSALKDVLTDTKPSELLNKNNFRIIESSIDLESFYSQNIRVDISSSSFFNIFKANAEFKSEIEEFVKEQTNTIYASGEVLFTTGSVFLSSLPILSEQSKNYLSVSYNTFTNYYSDVYIDESIFGVKACYLYRYTVNNSTTYTNKEIRTAVELKIKSLGDINLEAELTDTTKNILNSLSVEYKLLTNIDLDDFNVGSVTDYSSFLADVERLKQYVRENGHKVHAIQRKLRPYSETLDSQELIQDYIRYTDCSNDYNMWIELKESLDTFNNKELSAELRLEIDEAKTIVYENLTKSLYCENSQSPDLSMFNNLIERVRNYEVGPVDSPFSTNPNTKLYFSDVNGDGKDDKIYWNYRNFNGGVRVFLATSNGNFSNNYIQSKGSVSPNTDYNFADVNGDGKADKIYWNKDVEGGKIRVFLATSNGNFSDNDVQSKGSVSPNTDYNFADVDGDGKDDKIYWNKDVEGGKVRVFLATSNGNFTDNDVQSRGSVLANTKYYYSDVNGDGKDDKIYWNKDFEGGKTRVFLATSSGDFNYNAVTNSHSFSLSQNTIFNFSDVNGDGKADRIYWNRDNFDGNTRILLSTSDGNFSTNSIQNPFSTNPNTKLNYADVDGNGKADRIYWNRDNFNGYVRVFLSY